MSYVEKIAEATRKFAALQSDLSMSEDQQAELSTGLRRRSVVATTLLRRRKKAGGSVSDRVVYKSVNDIKLALSEFYLSLILLQNYQSLNFTGFRKILKKHDKVPQSVFGAFVFGAFVFGAADGVSPFIFRMSLSSENESAWQALSFSEDNCAALFARSYIEWF